MTKTILILTDGMADEPLPELGGKTPVEYANTPNMDAIANEGACGTFLSLPSGYPTSSDVANMSVMGYPPEEFYTGRGPLEAVSQGIEIGPDDIAWRCNLVQADGDMLIDYSGGHIDDADAHVLIDGLKQEFDCAEFTLYPGVSYRNILVLHGKDFTEKIKYAKPDDSQGKPISENLLHPADDSPEAINTAQYLNDLMSRTRGYLENHHINKSRAEPANLLWFSSPGRRPKLPSFKEKYGNVRGAIISAVDVIFGLGICAGMDVIKVPGATGFVDTNYEGKADAAVRALESYDFVYLHIEAADECSHMGDLELKIKAIEDIDKRVIARLRDQLQGQDVTYAVLPDHPVPVHLRIHTRDPVPVAICGKHIIRDHCRIFSETVAPTGTLGQFKRDELMRKILNCD